MNQYDGSILKAIEYIENRIDHEIPLDEIAKVAAFSKFHFTRIFKAVTKENLNDYIRKRRLTLAARALIETDMPIQQIGFTYGYSSQEAFTRAFKQYMGISPKSYRNKGIHYHNLYKEALSEPLLYLKKRQVPYKASIIQKPSFMIGGICLSGELNHHQISVLWNRFYDELQRFSINPETVACYGYESIDETNTPYYLAAIEMDRLENLPPGWRREVIPEHKYAAFTLENVIENIPNAMEEIYQNQLPAMNLKPVQNFSIEYYEADFMANDRTYTLKFLVPVE
ncbi:helix-turn-helix domain-containing protein [Thermicanus aegyptius]|uniref:helix-turn-helix domain-containing protein n=1 Tax=Thermicanus aegyptius TaxID=94009 RepID=UPI0003F96DE8|nr:helix-turn-helix domain-containing protein [Thermicanus aegyptius]